MKNFAFQLVRNFAWGFSGSNIIWHIVAICLTFILVVSGFDWAYYQFFKDTSVRVFLFPGIVLGGLLPILIPIIFFIMAKIKKDKKIFTFAVAITQAVILGSVMSSIYKSFTGRAHPIPFGELTTDITHIFNFGFLREGIFWGWPSSHTTIAFSMALTLCFVFPKNKLIQLLLIVYAFYIGLSVSMTIHWFSDFVAGAIIGTVIGITVGKSFIQKSSLS